MHVISKMEPAIDPQPPSVTLPRPSNGQKQHDYGQHNGVKGRKELNMAVSPILVLRYDRNVCICVFTR